MIRMAPTGSQQLLKSWILRNASCPFLETGEGRKEMRSQPREGHCWVAAWREHVDGSALEGDGRTDVAC